MKEAKPGEPGTESKLQPKPLVFSYESKPNEFWNDASAECTLRLVSDLSWKHLDIILDRKPVPTIHSEARRAVEDVEAQSATSNHPPNDTDV
jgi:hypothetical protein